MCPGICPADATRYKSRGKSFKTTVCTAERRSNPEKQDQRGATHTHNQTQRQTNPTKPFTYLSKYYWWTVLGSCKYSLMAYYTPLISWCSRYSSLLFYIRLWWEERTTHTHTVLHYPFPCWSIGVHLFLQVKATKGRDIVSQKQVGVVQTEWREEWMQIIWGQQTLLVLW